jgi:RNA polymerase sigma factor (sigma-70 family)
MIPKIRLWANGYLKNHDIGGPLRTKCVEECVPNAVLAFLSGVYHYDTEFDAWFCVLVQNVCRKHIKEQMRGSRVLEKEAVSVDQVGLMLERLADTNEMNSQRRRELRADLLDAAEKLSSEARQALIIGYYFSGFSFKQLSEKMNKSMTAVYKLHFDALKELREILGDTWN